ncbi:hypothetical protein [Streptomyces chartreusis]
MTDELLKLAPAVFGALIAAFAQAVWASDTRRALTAQIRSRPRLSVRAAFVILAVTACVILIAFDKIFFAGMALIFAAAVRLGHPRKGGWKVDDLEMHILTEMFFHLTALSGVAVGTNLMVVGAAHNLQTGQLVTISLALSLGALAAINKSSSRTRKLCTEVTKRATRASRNVVALHTFHDLERDSAEGYRKKLLDRQHDCHEAVDDLARALDTRFNTGYRQLGSRLLPETEFQHLVAALHKAVLDPTPTEEWLKSYRLLAKIEMVCAKHVDEVA